MQEELISKKDLLVEMNISYGQLYRWKRKNLIPEEWFIKKSVSTGQETFFPREKVLERVRKILQYKDDVSLDELAYKFSTNIKDIFLLRSYIIEQGIVPENIVISFEDFMGQQNKYDERSLFALFIYKEMILSGALSLDEMRNIAKKMKELYEKLGDEKYRFIVKRKLGVSFIMVTKEPDEMMIDDGVTILEVNLGKIMNEIKKYDI